MNEKILFFGLGRTGLPQSLVLAYRGFEVYGFDTDKELISKLSKSSVPFYEKSMKDILEKVLNKTFFPINNWREVIGDVDYIVFTIGTKAPDYISCIRDKNLSLGNIESTLLEVFSENFKRSVSIIFRNTLPLGSTDRLKEFVERNTPYREGKDFFLAFVPERITEGNAMEEEIKLPKIIGAYSKDGFLKVKKLFEKVGGKLIKVSSPKVAEFCKLTDNSFRNTIFAFSNELSLLSFKEGIDIIEVLKAVNDSYDRNFIPFPGYVSGYCLGKDPYIFQFPFNSISEERGFHSLWYYGRRVNDFLIDHTVKIIKYFMDKTENRSILLMGLSFKRDVDDFRMSHGIEILKKVVELDFTDIRVFDPFIDSSGKYTSVPKQLESYVKFKSRSLSTKLFKNVGFILLLTNHSVLENIDDKSIKEYISVSHKPLFIFDGWNSWRKYKSIFPKEIFYYSMGFRGGDI